MKIPYFHLYSSLKRARSILESPAVTADILKYCLTIVDLIQAYSSTAAGEIVEFIRANIYKVKRVIKKEKIKAEAELRQSFNVSLDKEDAEGMKRVFEE
jgi:hypothetical protein